MGVISVRFNKDEERILKKISDHFHEDKSILIKKSLIDLYENVMELLSNLVFAMLNQAAA